MFVGKEKYTMFTRVFETRNSKEKEALIALALAQEARHQAHSSQMLAAHGPAFIEAITQEPSLIVAIDAAGRLRGAVQPAIWQLKRDSILRAFLASRNGLARHLIVPDPQEADAPAVVDALLKALTDFWQHQDTDADLLRWPAQETWLPSLIGTHGFQLDSVCALRSLDSFFPAAPIVPPGISFRIAQPADEAALLRLFHEELRFHERSTPFVRSSPTVLQAFQHKLEQCWKGVSFEDGAPLIIVAQQGDTLVAMAENTLLTVSEQDDPGFTPPGRYWCIDNVSVLEPFHHQGIGSTLVQMIEHLRLTLELDLRGYVLWYNPDNTTAERFWTRLGFVPLWTTYQRRHVWEEV
jgi:GNAT superfamily N-acetyltransferase